MKDAGTDFIEWFREEFRKNPTFASEQVKLAAQEESLVALLDVLADVAEAYRERHPDASKKATRLWERLNDMRWPSLATGYPLRNGSGEQDAANEPAAASLPVRPSPDGFIQMDQT